MTTDDAVVKILKVLVTKYGSQKKAAAYLGISQGYLHDLIHSRRTAGPKVLDALGLVRVTRVVRTTPSS